MTTKQLIETCFRIVNKKGEEVPFILNEIQDRYLTQDYTGRDMILKARQQGFSSLILAMFALDFIGKKNSYSVVVADISDNAIDLLERVKFYLRVFEDLQKTKIPLKYNSKTELFNEAMNSRYKIGTADNSDFGRSKTITNLHLSECFFYPNFESIMAGALQAVVPDGRVIFETTANGFNYGKTFWDECKAGERPFKPLFYPASHFYDEETLKVKRKELGRLFKQEYPESDIEAFLSSGANYFDTEALESYLSSTKRPMDLLLDKKGLVYI